MASPIGDTLGISAQLLPLREQRLNLIASNLANADTPGYKARDMDFQTALKAANQGPKANMLRTHVRHLQLPSHTQMSPGVIEREVSQPSLDGNTVNSEVEHAAYARATLEYRASLTFIEARVRGLMTAITGQ